MRHYYLALHFMMLGGAGFYSSRHCYRLGFHSFDKVLRGWFLFSTLLLLPTEGGFLDRKSDGCGGYGGYGSYGGGAIGE